MTIPLRQLLEGRSPPLTIREDQTIETALSLMLGHDFNQLPVVDAAGCLTGIVSEQTILRTYYHSEGKVSLLSLTVPHCQEQALTLELDDDLLDVLEVLEDRDNYAVIIVDEQKRPTGILTHYDMTNFFREVSEGQLFVETVELTLRRYIEEAFPDKEAMKGALMAAFGPDRRKPERPARDYHHLGFLDHVRLITDDDNWPHFERALAPQELFWSLMNQVRQTRNQLAHYRGRPTSLQYNGLRTALDWLATRPPLGTNGQNDEAQAAVKRERKK